MRVLTPISLGELYDKISILEIKSYRIEDSSKLTNINSELEELYKTAEDYPIENSLFNKLRDVNEDLWDVEDKIRREERNKDYGENFIQLARSVYFNNDKRAEIKREINMKYGSDIMEEKSYEEY